MKFTNSPFTIHDKNMNALDYQKSMYIRNQLKLGNNNLGKLIRDLPSSMNSPHPIPINKLFS